MSKQDIKTQPEYINPSILLSERDGKEDLSTILAIYEQGKERGTKMTSFIAPRQLVREQHRAITQERTFLSALNPKARERAVIMKNEGELLSNLVTGIDADPLIGKVIIGLVQLLNEQNQLFKRGKGGMKEITMEILEANTRLIAEEFKKLEQKSSEENVIKDEPTNSQALRYSLVCGNVTKDEPTNSQGLPIAFFPYVIVPIAYFTRKVLGLDEGTKLTTTMKNQVKDALETLREKKVWFPTANGKWLSSTLIGKERAELDPKTKQEIRIIELDNIFTKNLMRDFVILPSDILKRLKGNQKVITMRLFWLLVEQRSYITNSEKNEVRINKEKLLDKVAIISKYKDHPSVLKADLKKAIQKMAEIRLIEDSVREVIDNKNVKNVYIFTYRDDFYKVHPTTEK